MLSPLKPGPPSSSVLGVGWVPAGRAVGNTVGMGDSSAARLESSAPLASLENSCRRRGDTRARERGVLGTVVHTELAELEERRRAEHRAVRGSPHNSGGGGGA